MNWLLQTILLTSVLFVLAPADGDATLVALSLDPALSSLTPEAGPAQSLSGTLVIDVGSLPLGGSNTSFDVVALALTTSGGATFALDPGIPSPGLGVLNAAGSFLVPTLFVRITDGDVTDLSIPDVSGNVVFGAGGASIAGLATAFEIATSSGTVALNLVAVPEPGPAILLALGLVALCTRGSRREIR